MDHHRRIDGGLSHPSFERYYNEPRPPKADIRDFLKMANGQPLAVDTETTGFKVYDGRDYLTGLSIAFKDANGKKHAHYFPFRHRGPGNYDQDELAAVTTLITTAPLIVFHNVKFDLASLLTIGIDYQGKWYDTAIMAHLINENRPFSKELNSLLRFYIGPHMQKAKSIELDVVIDAYGWANVPAALMRKYATMDADLTLDLIEALWPYWHAQDLDPYWWRQKQPLVNVVRKMEQRGIRVDVPYCEKMREKAAYAMDDMRYHLGEMNPGSHQSQYKYLVEILGIPEYKVEKKKKNKETGEQETYEAVTFDSKSYKDHWGPWLERLNEPLAEYVLGYRGWQKADSSFYRAYIDLLSPDGRLRPKYKHHKDDEEGGTVTGRLSCSDPNLQQIPKSSNKPWNGGVKRAFIPQEGYELWEVDYSQLELRLGAAYANVRELIEAFNDPDRDIFAEMSGPLGLTRDGTKTFVYSTQYGAGIKRLMSALGFTAAQAAEVKDNYYKAYPGFKRISDWCKSTVLKTKELTLWSGRKRHFVNPRKEAHKALNSMIQGGAADIVECKMVEVYNKIDQKSNDEVRMLLQVHDSIIFEIKQGTAEKWLPQIEDIMSDMTTIEPSGFGGVKFAVDAKPLHDNYKGNYGKAA